MEDAMAKKQQQSQSKPRQRSGKQPCQPLEEFDPLSEESTDYRAPGEKIELLGEGKNFDRNRMDQPRTNLESLPKAHKDKTGASQRHDSFEKEQRKRREGKKKRVA
jgi:hypothetical protein